MSEHLSHELAYRGNSVVENRAKKSILILGVGALGSWLVDLLARQGYENMSVLDFDRVERKNFGTQNYGRVDIGRMKSTILSNNLLIRLGISCRSITDKLTESNAKKILSGGYDLVIDAFDNHESRNLVQKTCLDLNIECLHVGMSGDGFVEVAWNKDYSAHPAISSVNDKGEPCEYPLASNLVYFAVAIAAETINAWIDLSEKNTVHFTIKDMHCHVLKGNKSVKNVK